MGYEEIFVNICLIKGLVSKTCKEILRFNNKKTNHPYKKWESNLNRNFTKEDVQTVNKHMKRCSTSFVIRDLQIKTTMKYHYIPIRLAKF